MRAYGAVAAGGSAFPAAQRDDDLLVKPALGTRRDRGTSWRFAMTCHTSEPRPGVWHERAALMVRTELVVDGETIQSSAERTLDPSCPEASNRPYA